MEIFKQKDFERLSDVHKPFCVSIYIPTHRISTPGKEMDEDRIELKNQLQDAKDQLIIHGMKESETDPYLKPIAKLLDNKEFWNYQSDGLAIFYSGKEVETFHVPIEFKSYAYVSERYYLLPLAGMLHDSSTHFILELSLDHVKLYEATRYTIAEVGISHLVPTQLEDAVGYDYEEKQLGRRSNQGESGDAEGLYHGHGSGNDTEKKKEAFEYFRQINDGLMKLLNDEDKPMIVASVDYLFPIYRDANQYQYLMNEHIEGNFCDEDLLTLKEKAWNIMKPQVESTRVNAKEKYKAQLNEGKSAASPETVIPASMAGRTETLFVKNEAHLWGKYKLKEHSIEINQVRKVGDADLLNLAAIETIKHNGKVYVVNENEMPDSTSVVNGVFRYAR